MGLKPISNSLATLSTLTSTCGNRLRAIIDISRSTSVPSEILALANEVGDLRIVLDEVESQHEASEQAGAPSYRILQLLGSAQSRVMELNRLVMSSVELGQHNEPIFRKNTWMKARRSRAILQELRDIKQNVVVIMTMIGSKTS